METSESHSVKPSLITSILVQRRVIWALVLREMLTRYGRNNIGFLWLFLEPMLFIVIITVLWTALRDIHNSSIPIMAFALTGYASVLLWRNLPSRCMGAIESNKTLLHHRHVKAIDIFFSRIILEQSAVTTSFFVLGLLMWIFGWIDPPEDVLKVFWGWILLALFGTGLALTLAALAERWEVIAKFWAPFSVILFPISGAAFMVDALPPSAQKFALYLPMIHGVEYIREGFFGTKIVAHHDLGYLSIWSLILTLFGLSQTRRVGTSRDA